MGWFSKEPVKEKEYAKRKTKVIAEKQKFNIGRTIVELTFEDGKTFNTLVYGSVHQTYDNGSDEGIYCTLREPWISERQITKSIHQAECYITTLSSNLMNYVDDPRKSRYSMFGKAVSARITEDATSDYEEESTVYKIVPV